MTPTGSLVGNPFELLKVRMQSKDYEYRHVFDGLKQVTRKEGITSLWNGTMTAMIRSSLFSASQLATYDHSKTMISKYSILDDGTLLKFCAAMISGLVTTTVSTPADFVKSVVMNGSNDERPIGVFVRILRRDYGRGFFKGWFANYLRLGPHTIMTMLTFETLRQLAGLDSL